MEILKENASVIQFATYNYCPFFHETTFILSTVANPLFQNNHKHPTVLRLTAPCNKRPYLSLSLKWACTVTHAHAHIPPTHTRTCHAHIYATRHLLPHTDGKWEEENLKKLICIYQRVLVQRKTNHSTLRGKTCLNICKQ